MELAPLNSTCSDANLATRTSSNGTGAGANECNRSTGMLHLLSTFGCCNHRQRNPSWLRKTLSLSLIVGSTVAVVVVLLSSFPVLDSTSSTSAHYYNSDKNPASSAFSPPPLSHPPTVAFCGNSMLYYNDCPRLVEILLTQMYNNLTTTTVAQQQTTRLQDSCLRGGANLASLWDEGNGMQTKFGINHKGLARAVDDHGSGDDDDNDDNNNDDDIGAPTVASLFQNPPFFDTSNNQNTHNSRGWNYILLQDLEVYSTKSADDGRPVSLQALREHYLPSIQKLSQQQPPVSPPTVLLLETFAYQSPRLRETIGLGGMEEFTDALVLGYQEYANLVHDFGLDYRIIPMATAVEQLSTITNDNNDDNLTDLWDRIYSHDGVHPSPHGTWLQACLIVAMATGRAPPVLWDDNNDMVIATTWQRRARHWSMERNRQSPSPLPTMKEAEALRQLACQVVFTTFKKGNIIDPDACGQAPN